MQTMSTIPGVRRRVAAALAAALLIGGAPMAGSPASLHAQELSGPFHVGFTLFVASLSGLGLTVAYTYLAIQGDVVSHTLQNGVP
jgi:hypothetical protein